MDIDIALPKHVKKHGGLTIDQLLLQAGYHALVSASDIPVVRYELASPATQIEFLTPEIGKPGNAILKVQHGLAAQPLRYLQILLENTRRIEINDTIDGSAIGLAVTVPSPGAFVYQKGLTVSPRYRRPAAKVDKDLYYIFSFVDPSTEFGDSVAAEISSLQARYPANWFRSFIRNLNHYFPESGGAGPARVEDQYSGPMPAETFRNYVRHTFRGFIQALQDISAL
jgi:hypothetical protein